MSKISKLIGYASKVKAQTGKSIPSQLMEIKRLHRSGLRLGIEEYYELEIFNDQLYEDRRKADCVGWRASAAMDAHLNHSYWRAIANDKLLNYALLQHYGFPIPDTIAIFSPEGRHIGGEVRLRTESELATFITHSLQYPVFVKPISGSYGRGTHLFTAFDPSTASLIDSRGERTHLSDFITSCTNPYYHGMLFQKCLQPHSEVRAMTGDTTSCVRVIVVNVENQPRVHMTFWKIARARNITDNFCMGETGNLLACINKANGKIENVISGLWPTGSKIPQHPDTGQQLEGRTLPDWAEAMKICLSAAIHFPGLRLQNWDVALCEQGPVLMELNTESDLAIPQYLSRTPFIDDSIRTLLPASSSRLS